VFVLPFVVNRELTALVAANETFALDPAPVTVTAIDDVLLKDNTFAETVEPELAVTLTAALFAALYARLA
jgi:hypothetical protein